ncbi:DUF2523 family protein [Xanthomonas theicola]|uniref:DUF2523 domain-containing protein n=1 Tax=Xanthomonas theicola TaxID=56464 RepID=A0A2S6Z6A8_9XANT|nr:DUF2523 family protein [Xanthomonas theicola]PPT76861.1 hypothetical protein XthCFBP4691_19500 [Xanthomonas theicola]QNH24712.1 DUF2523 domain-containing protein [Xanthomonas theicola]
MPVWLAALVPTILAALGQAFRAFWPQIIRGIGWLFKSRIGLFITSAFVWLGINFGTIKFAIEPAIDQLKAFAQSGAPGGQLGQTAMQWAGMLNLDKALTMVVSAIIAKHALMQGRLFLFKRGFGGKP